MTVPKYDLTVAISSFNRDDKVRKTVEQLLKTDPAGFENIEVVIVDDGSPRPVEDAIRDLTDVPAPFDLRIVRTENRGIGSARNRGYSEARADLVLFLDDDILVERDILRKMKDAHESEPCGIIFGSYPFVSHESDSLRQFASKLYGYDRITDRPVYEYVDGITSGLLSVRKSRLSDAEKFYRDDLTIPAAEEHELIYRFNRTGQKIAQGRHIAAIHNHHLELAWIVNQQFKYGQATAEVFEKYPGIEAMTRFAELKRSMEGGALKSAVKDIVASSPIRRGLLALAEAVQRLAPKSNHEKLFGLLTTAYFRAGYKQGPGTR